MSHATLCILSYERPQFLKVAIETAIAGCDEPVEVIVHDDGSADPELLKYLYTIHQQGLVSTVMLNAPGINRGQGVALNRMFHTATGDPIIKIDHDLIFTPGWLSACREILLDDRVGLLGLFKYEHEPVDWHNTATDVQPEPSEDPSLVGYSFHTHICGSAMVIPRRVWELIGPFEEGWESFGEDWQFQKDVTATDGLYCALPDNDLVQNVGFGLGPSTVVVPNPETGQPEPRLVHQLPMLVTR